MKNSFLQCIVLEDEDDIRNWIVEKLQTFPELQIIGEAATIDDAFYLLAKQQPDVAFMDIRLIGGEAFQLLDRLKRNNLPIPYIICATGYPDYVMTALNDYRSYVLQYILKPFADNWEVKFRKAIDAVIAAKLNSGNKRDSKQNIYTHTFLNYQGGLIKFEFNKIAYLEAAGGGKSIIVMDEKLYEVDYTLAKLITIFPTSFFKISRSNVINTNRIKSIHKGDRTVELICAPKNKYISITETYYNDFLDKLPLGKTQLLDD